jgi:hypothetical protein
MRAVSGMQLAGEILTSLDSLISTKGSSQKLSIQFGAYATFLSFFGLVDLPATNPDFRGIVDYASSMAFELFTDADVSSGGSWPSTDDLQVRFLFHNGTATNESAPAVFPLFGTQNNAVSYKDFSDRLGQFAIQNTEQWCGKCGNSTGACAAYANKGDAAPAASQHGSALSPAIGGVIGAFVTLAVVLAAVAGLMLVGGFTLARGRKGGKGAEEVSVETKA